MPDEAAPATPAVAASPAPAQAPATPAPEQTQATQSEAEKKALAERKEFRQARVKRQFERLEKEQSKFQAEQLSWREQSANALREAAEFRRLQKLAKEDPIKFLEAGGHKFEDVIKKTATRGTVTPESIEAQIEERVQARLKAFEDKQAEAQRVRDVESRKSAEANQIRAAKEQIAALAKANADKYEFAGQSQESIDDAWELIVETYKETMDPKTGKGGVTLSYAEALDRIEDALLTSYLDRTKSSKKVRAALEAEATRAAEEAKKAAADKAAAEAKARGVTGPVKPAEGQVALQAQAEKPNKRPFVSLAERVRARQEAYRVAKTANDA